MAVVYVDDITGQQYDEEEWFAHRVYRFAIYENGQRGVMLETVNLPALIDALQGEVGGGEEFDEGTEYEFTEEVDKEDEASKGKVTINRIDSEQISDEQLREIENNVRNSSQGIAGLRVNNRDVE